MIHLHPTAELAERVLLPGDPGRALRLAQQLLEQPRMLNHNRGLWGYTGTAHDGRPLSIQSTGMGGPSAAIVVHELIDLGARRIVRVGTCGALAEQLELGARRLLRVGTCGGLDPSLPLGGLLVATGALVADGTSRALGAGERVDPSPVLLAARRRAAGEAVADGSIVTTDLFYDARACEDGWRAAGARAVEMESAALFALAGRRGVQAATLLIVSDLLGDDRERIEPAALELAEAAMGRVAASALADAGPA